jgi:hypothetical protein
MINTRKIFQQVLAHPARRAAYLRLPLSRMKTVRGAFSAEWAWEWGQTFHRLLPGYPASFLLSFSG